MFFYGPYVAFFIYIFDLINGIFLLGFIFRHNTRNKVSYIFNSRLISPPPSTLRIIWFNRKNFYITMLNKPFINILSNLKILCLLIVVKWIPHERSVLTPISISGFP